MEPWLTVHLKPDIDFRFHEGEVEGQPVVVLEIPGSRRAPVRWRDTSYIRVGSHKKKLSDFPAKEESLWELLLRSGTAFEKQIAKAGVTAEEVLALLNFASYFELTKQPFPSSTTGILERLEKEGMLVRRATHVDITNFGALLFANRLSDFPGLRRKSVRVITYTGENRTSSGREYLAEAGYASGFESLVAYINSQLPINEHIGQAFRVETPTYPEITIRELVPNAMLHQDLTVTGTSPMVEIFPDRMEISNPGRPLIAPLRFADEPPRSRNEELAAFMRRIHICEERGSGIDKVLTAIELYQLPAPDFAETQDATRATLFAKREFREMSGQERVKVCYWHASLLFVSGRQMTNETLRKRFGLEDGKHNQVGRIIADAREARLIKPYDPDNKSPRYARYVPIWA